MTISEASTSRLSTCVNNTLAQVKLVGEENHYPIATNDLLIWDHCPLCSSQNLSRISDVSLNKDIVFFSTDICLDCMHLFRQISPSTDWFVDRWEQISTGQLAVYNPSLEEKRRVRYELYYGILQKYKMNGVVLDVGAAYGSGTSVFIRRGYEAEALEPENDRAEYIKKALNIPVYSTTLEAFEPDAHKYDTIIFAHCLEHLNDPKAALHSLKRWMKQDGILYLEIPIAWNVIDWQDNTFMAHKHNFTEKNLKKLLLESGFSILDSYLIPDNDAFFCNLALICQPSEAPSVARAASTDLIDPPSYDKDKLTSMYRLGLPHMMAPEGAIHFSTPYINNFYHIYKGKRESLSSSDGYIEFNK